MGRRKKILWRGMLAIVALVALAGWTSEDSLRYRGIVGFRPEIAFREEITNPPHAYTWDESAADVVERTARLLTPGKGWVRSGSLVDRFGGVRFRRLRSPNFVFFSHGRLLVNHGDFELVDTVTIWAAYARSKEDGGESPPSFVEKPWTTVTIEDGRLDLKIKFCGMEVDPRYGMHLSAAPVRGHFLK